MHHFHAYPVGKFDFWQEDLLGQDILAVGQTVKITLPGPLCSYDFRAVLENGATIEKPNINICTNGTLQFTE